MPKQMSAQKPNLASSAGKHKTAPLSGPGKPVEILDFKKEAEIPNAPLTMLHRGETALLSSIEPIDISL